MQKLVNTSKPTSDQKLRSKEIFIVQRKDFPRIHPDVAIHQCTLRCIPGMHVEEGYLAYVSLWIPLI